MLSEKQIGIIYQNRSKINKTRY